MGHLDVPRRTGFGRGSYDEDVPSGCSDGGVDTGGVQVVRFSLSLLLGRRCLRGGGRYLEDGARPSLSWVRIEIWMQEKESERKSAQ